MPVYTSTVPDLATSGPSIQIAVGPSRELIAAFAPLGIELSSPHPAAAIVDTGAHTTVVSAELVAKLHIQPVGTAPICTPSTTSALMCDRYHVNIYFAEDFVVENVFAIEAPMGGVPYQCLIGRDILRFATLLYIGRQNRFELTF